MHDFGIKMFSGAPKIPTGKNPTFVPRDVENERLRQKSCYFFFLLRYFVYLQGTMSATKIKIYTLIWRIMDPFANIYKKLLTIRVADGLLGSFFDKYF